MSVCSECKSVGGYHKSWCLRLHVHRSIPALKPKSEQEYTIEKCGGLTVYHPVGSQYPDLQPRQDTLWLQPWFIQEWNDIYERTAKRGEAITFYREVEERRAA